MPPQWLFMKRKFLPHLLNVEGKMRRRDVEIEFRWRFLSGVTAALDRLPPTWLSAILLVSSLWMRSEHRSLRAHIAVDSPRSTGSVSASAQDYKSILHTCNLRGHAAAETENEREKKGGARPEGFGRTARNTDGEILKVKNDAVWLEDKECPLTLPHTHHLLLLSPPNSTSFKPGKKKQCTLYICWQTAEVAIHFLLPTTRLLWTSCSALFTPTLLLSLSLNQHTCTTHSMLTSCVGLPYQQAGGGGFFV